MNQPGGNRKSAPGVRDGRVQKKNRQDLSPGLYTHESDELPMVRLRPIKGLYHAVSVSDVRRWIALIPGWDRLAIGLRSIILTPGGDDAYGVYSSFGVISLDAWPRVEPHVIPDRKAWLMDRLGLDGREGTEVVMSPAQVRAHLLLGTFLHELGHHRDRMETRSQWECSNGESYAIAYEVRAQRQLWQAYLSAFGDPNAS